MTRDLAGEIQLSDLFFEILTLNQGGYCCSQIIMKLALRELGQENPELVRAMAGLCFGAGSPEGACGVLTGAACALSLSLGTAELPDPRLPLAAQRTDRLVQRPGGRHLRRDELCGDSGGESQQARLR